MASNDPFSTRDGDKSTSDSSAHDRATVYEGMSVQLVPAPVSKRIIAYCLDMALVTVCLYILALVFVWLALGGIGMSGFIRGFIGSNNMDSTMGMIIAALLIIGGILIFASIYHGYFIYFEYKRGMTPGKRVFGLKVISLGSSRLSVGQCVLRDLFRYIDCGLIVPGLVSMAATQRKQRLGDLAAATLVVYSAQKEAQAQHLYLASEDYQLLREAVPFRLVSIEDCKHFLAFAYPEFVMATHFSSQDQLSEWETWVRSFISGSPTQTLDQRTLLLYFAEYCFQTLNHTK